MANLKNIKTCKDFITAFNSEYINDFYIPHKSKIIILEDIDCMIDIVKSRKIDENPDFTDLCNIQNDMAKMMIMKEKMDDEKEKRVSLRENDKLTLSCILNTIDGVLESYGRILIITTNYVDKLDDALIRPGRIDCKVKFSYCTNQMFYDIIEHQFECSLQKGIKFNENKYTPAEVIDMCCLHNDNLNMIIDHFRVN